MNAEKLLKNMDAEMDSIEAELDIMDDEKSKLVERRLGRFVLRAMAPRLVIGVVVFGLWKWLLATYVYFEFGGLDRLIDYFGVAAIFYVTVRPLFVIMRMDDDEMDRILPDDS